MKKDYYIFTSGEIKRENNSIVFFDLEKNKKCIPIMGIDDLYIFSHVTLNVDFINFISQSGINIHFFDYYGNYTSTLSSKEQQISGFVKINQAKMYLNNCDRLYIAQQFLLSAFNTIYKNLQDYKITMDIEIYKTKLLNTTLENIMAIEAEFRKKYYSKWDETILKYFKFEKRTKRPPENEINALISFGNMMCYSLCLKQIKKTYLDSTISFLHEPSDRRHSLSLDIAEIFKPLFVDRVIFNLVNRKIINSKDFVRIGSLCHLNDVGKKKFIQAFQEKLETTIFIEKLNKNIAYENLVKYECYKIIKHVTGDEKYNSLRIYW
jgi:CRISPR-associated protein Cas1